jgi:tripartite-type tricarboxylate transporter receptor subunit TctC
VPNVPTYGEAGFPDFYSSTWVGFFVPAKTQDAVVTRLGAELNAIIAEKDTQERFRIIGFEPIMKSEAETIAYFKSEVATWGKMSKAIGFQTD